MELLKMYGEVKYFRLMMDRQTGNSRVSRRGPNLSAGLKPADQKAASCTATHLQTGHHLRAHSSASG
jgi:hypothetical protein